MIQTIRDISIICASSVTVILLISILISSLVPCGGVISKSDEG